MKKLLYPLMASAFITIMPFLLTFEKGQDIVRGIFGYEEFALLLFFIFVKERIIGANLFGRGAFVLFVLIVALFSVAWIDLTNLLSLKKQSVGWYGLIPVMTCLLAIVMIWKIKAFEFNKICFVLLVSLIMHLLGGSYYAAQPLMHFPTVDFLEKNAPKPVQRSNIANDFKERYFVVDSVSVTRNYIDTTRDNVIILVESWGVPLELQQFNRQMNLFDGTVVTKGIHNRMYSRTRTAEREDLIMSIVRDSSGKRDTTFLPKVLADKGYKTTFLFGGDSLEQSRFKYIANIGFNNMIFGNGLKDDSMIEKIDSILSSESQKNFIAWTTTATKFPMIEFSSVYNIDAEIVDSVYNAKLGQSLLQIALLARKHPNVRFVIQGDHNPILSPIKFQEKFYKRWVPFVVLN